MQALPIFMNINQRLCVVIGAGEVAARKVTMLLRAQASVTVYAPEICPTLADLVEAGRIRYQQARFADQQLSGACLVIAATNDLQVNTAVSLAAQANNIPVNVVDAPALCTFTMASIVERSSIVIAIASEGNAPVLARY